MKHPLHLLALLLPVILIANASAQQPDRKLRIIAFGAHPDDCELQVGGTAALWAQQGHHVKFVSLTNGDIGHWREAGGPLAQRRLKEVQAAAKMLGNTVEVLDIHDGELMPTLENRRTVIRLIRQHKADIVLSHRPWDYHPDHRNTALLVQDAAYMVTVPFICPDIEPLKTNPVFLYYTDRFQKPYPSQADIVISIDAVIDRKLDALAVMESQFLEGGANGHEGLLPKSDAQRQHRIQQVRQTQQARFRAVAERFRAQAAELYGAEKAAAIAYAEAFEICEYGRRPEKDELKKLFPINTPNGSFDRQHIEAGQYPAHCGPPALGGGLAADDSWVEEASKRAAGGGLGGVCNFRPGRELGGAFSTSARKTRSYGERASCLGIWTIAAA